ncbi:MAG TPA: response regulator transcription factor [Burkholderiales bacterium]|jgi:CheY-like chemotaxis protein
MSGLRPTVIKNEDLFALTEKGNAELKATGTSLAATELQVLILIDGKTSVEQIGRSAPNLAAAEIVETLKKFFGSRLITNATEPSSDGLESGFFSIDVPAGFFTSATPKDDSEAERGASSLKQDGYYVRIARRPAGKREVKEGQKFTVLVVDDDPDLAKLMRTYLSLEGFVPRLAGNRAEFLAMLRQSPIPDLVLLDVDLPDVNGFDILVKMRQHAALKAIPVVMLTAEATRQAVLKGLLAGADGYVTKPFDPEAVTTAVKAVLGLTPPPQSKAEAKSK